MIFSGHTAAFRWPGGFLFASIDWTSFNRPLKVLRTNARLKVVRFAHLHGAFASNVEPVDDRCRLVGFVVDEGAIFPLIDVTHVSIM